MYTTDDRMERKKAWFQFTETGIVKADTTILRDEIADSWQRSRKNNVDVFEAEPVMVPTQSCKQLLCQRKSF